MDIIEEQIEQPQEEEEDERDEDEESLDDESDAEFDQETEEESLKDTVVVMEMDDDFEPKKKQKREKKFIRPRNPATTRKYKYNFKCVQSPKGNQTPRGLNHVLHPLYRCSQCPIVLHSKHHLELHEKKHSPEKKPLKPCVCEVCGKSFNAPSLLRAHSTRHSNERPFPCDVCGMAFKNAYGLRCHQETHDGKKYICPMCGLALGSNHTYHAHLKTHSDKRQYKCVVCPKTFKRHTPLKVKRGGMVYS